MDIENKYEIQNNKECIEEITCEMLKSEKQILKCLETLLCKITTDIGNLDDIDKKVKLSQNVICAYAEKEESIARMVEAIGNLKKVQRINTRPCCSPWCKKY